MWEKNKDTIEKNKLEKRQGKINFQSTRTVKITCQEKKNTKK